MTIKPIDMQTMVPKATEIAKVQNIMNENMDNGKAIIAAGFQEQIKTTRHKVNERDKTEKAKLQKDQQSSQNGNKKNKKKREEKQEMIKKLNHHIDVKI